MKKAKKKERERERDEKKESVCAGKRDLAKIAYPFTPSHDLLRGRMRERERVRERERKKESKRKFLRQTNINNSTRVAERDKQQ